MSGKAAGQALAVTHGLAGAAVAAWLVLIGRESAWAALACAVFALLAVLVGWFAASKGRRRGALAALAGWTAAALVGGHLLLSAHEGVWRGFRLDAELGWYPQADLADAVFESAEGTYRASTDRFGHRNRLAYPADGRLPVMVQGDSNIFGFGLGEDETYCARWAARGGQPCYNVGVSGYDPQHYVFQADWLRARGLVPALRVVVFNLGNDYSMTALTTPYLLPRPYLTADGETRRVEQPFRRQVYGHHFIPPLARFDDGLATVTLGRDWSCVPTWIERVPLAAFALEKLGSRAVKAWVHLFGREAEIRGKVYNPYYPAWQLQAVDRWPEPYRLFLPHFEAVMARLAAQPAERTVVVLMPMKDRMALPPGHGEADSLADVVADISRRHGMTVIDPTPAFLARPDRAALFQPDGHLTAGGMDLLVAETLAALDRSQGGSTGP